MLAVAMTSSSFVTPSPPRWGLNLSRALGDFHYKAPTTITNKQTNATQTTYTL